jgi:hypothetical protein
MLTSAVVAGNAPRLHRFLPFLLWRHRVKRDTVRVDFIAGLTGAIAVLPAVGSA